MKIMKYLSVYCIHIFFDKKTSIKLHFFFFFLKTLLLICDSNFSNNILSYYTKKNILSQIIYNLQSG